jgi:hypothetical protein
MARAPGTRLGPYEIGALIGAGGIGEGHRAHDARLDPPSLRRITLVLNWTAVLKK